VKHSGEKGSDNIEELGTYPPIYWEMKTTAFAAQAVEDEADDLATGHIFDLPLQLAESLTGFSHDKEIKGQFEALRKKSAPGFFARLFGKQ